MKFTKNTKAKLKAEKARKLSLELDLNRATLARIETKQLSPVQVSDAAAKLVRRGTVDYQTFRWWHSEVRKVNRGHYAPDHVMSNLGHVTEALA